MKTHLLFASTLSFAVLACAAQNALAESGDYGYRPTTTSVTTRAQVQADARNARAAGLIANCEACDVTPTQDVSSLTRAQVRAESIEARKRGLITTGELPPKQPTAADLEAVQRAGLDAVQSRVAAKSM